MNCYTERAHLLALLTHTYPAQGYEDPEGEEGYRTVLALFIRDRWLCWHIADGDLHLFAHVPKLPSPEIFVGVPLYDGHSTAEKYHVIRLAIMQSMR